MHICMLIVHNHYPKKLPSRAGAAAQQAQAHVPAITLDDVIEKLFSLFGSILQNW